MKKITRRQWSTIILFGLIGQIAWAIENNEFNLFLFNEIGGSTGDIAVMVAASAIVATLTTLFIGAVSDRLGHRKLFLCLGYVFWGLSTMVFALISRGNVAKFVSAEKVLSVSAGLVVFMDCVMTFFGSSANDAAFNSWVTESTDESNRTRVEGVLNAFPLLSMLIVVGASNIIIEQTGWPLYFIVIGLLVIICGIAGLFFVPDSQSEKTEKKDSLIKEILYGFRLSVVKENPLFYLSLLTLCIYNCATQIFMPYLFIYLNKTLGYDVLTYSLVMAVTVLTASVFAILFSGKIDVLGKKKAITLAVIIYAAGLFLAGIIRNPVVFTLVASVMMIGFVSISVIIMASIRDHTPKAHVGMFQGIRLFAYVLIPMIIGPYIGNLIISLSSSGTYVNDYGEIVQLPVPAVFFAAAAASLLILIPAHKLYKEN